MNLSLGGARAPTSLTPTPHGDAELMSTTTLGSDATYFSRAVLVLPAFTATLCAASTCVNLFVDADITKCGSVSSEPDRSARSTKGITVRFGNRVRSKSLVVGVVAAALVLGGVSAASATTSYPEGGTWHYGTNGSFVYSNYFHARRWHSATVENCDRVRLAKSIARPGLWASARSYGGCPVKGRVDHAYYNVW
ncbi:MAG: hypothetical protein B5766_08850 [Candidatus Lumbricidophila eiseniae]|uniref:Lactococcin 972 family bacteriocin n=1 Tax=Candidatus Lumbricidiphila eiseniae TaxID=1969409 RepID=A0A2A6FQ95_9MICO|nr:MAG: hypothetical protein B5766_08850 [Candidatus Lumbricidophila eiseniae]